MRAFREIAELTRSDFRADRFGFADALRDELGNAECVPRTRPFIEFSLAAPLLLVMLLQFRAHN
jgi:hypothetical protein